MFHLFRQSSLTVCVLLFLSIFMGISLSDFKLLAQEECHQECDEGFSLPNPWLLAGTAVVGGVAGGGLVYSLTSHQGEKGERGSLGPQGPAAPAAFVVDSDQKLEVALIIDLIVTGSEPLSLMGFISAPNGDDMSTAPLLVNPQPAAVQRITISFPPFIDPLFGTYIAGIQALSSSTTVQSMSIQVLSSREEASFTALIALPANPQLSLNNLISGQFVYLNPSE